MKWLRELLALLWLGIRESGALQPSMPPPAPLKVRCASAKQVVIRVEFRPLLVSGMLASSANGPIILIDSEQCELEQARAIWHEALHLLGMIDEPRAEELAMRLAKSCPDIVQELKR